MINAIVTTTINPPTKAIRIFDSMKNWILIVIGDKKTPSGYMLKNGYYICPEDQEKMDKKLSDAIGWNCIQRRSFGLLKAYELGADVIALVDDDNIPFNDDWGTDLMINKETEVNYYETDIPAFDPLGVTNHNNLWHRGYPLELIPHRGNKKKVLKKIIPDIQADFWNGDPDIDAICRMQFMPVCKFEDEYFPIASNRISPFNSQNTFISSKVLPNYFLFPHVGRMDDIWASYYIQALGFKVVYNKPTVFQERNPHDLIKDMKMEYPGYENNLKLINDLIEDPERIFWYLPAESARAFKLYQKHFNL